MRTGLSSQPKNSPETKGVTRNGVDPKHPHLDLHKCQPAVRRLTRAPPPASGGACRCAAAAAGPRRRTLPAGRWHSTHHPKFAAGPSRAPRDACLRPQVLAAQDGRGVCLQRALNVAAPVVCHGGLQVPLNRLLQALLPASLLHPAEASQLVATDVVPPAGDRRDARTRQGGRDAALLAGA